MTEPETPGDERTGFAEVVGITDGSRVGGQVKDDLVDFWVGCQDGDVDLVDGGWDGYIWVFTLDGAESDVGVLDEWAEIAFEGCTTLDVECVVVYPIDQLSSFQNSKHGLKGW